MLLSNYVFMKKNYFKSALFTSLSRAQTEVEKLLSWWMKAHEKDNVKYCVTSQIENIYCVLQNTRQKANVGNILGSVRESGELKSRLKL